MTISDILTIINYGSNIVELTFISVRNILKIKSHLNDETGDLVTGVSPTVLKVNNMILNKREVAIIL